MQRVKEETENDNYVACNQRNWGINNVIKSKSLVIITTLMNLSCVKDEASYDMSAISSKYQFEMLIAGTKQWRSILVLMVAHGEKSRTNHL